MAEENNEICISMSRIIDRIDDLLNWLYSAGNGSLNPSGNSYVSSKITVKDVKASGRGIYATDEISPYQRIIRIPPSFLLNKMTAIKHITSFNPDIVLRDPSYKNIFVPRNDDESIFTEVYSRLTYKELSELSAFQIISFYLTYEKQRGKESFWEPFIATLPNMSEFRLVPLYWKVMEVEDHEKLYDLLPWAARNKTSEMYNLFINDYDVVKKLVHSKIPSFELLLEDFLWSWISINSRCLYMKIPDSKSEKDNFTMAPYVDFLNHCEEDHCSIKIDSTGFQMYTGTKYNLGDQLFLRYGPHSNDFLLCEYYFVYPGNKWNYVDITEYIKPLLRPQQEVFLKETGYLGDYTISMTSGISFRTEVVLATLQEHNPSNSRKLQAFLNGYIDGEVYQDKSNILLKAILEKLLFLCDSRTNLAYRNSSTVSDERLKVIGALYRDIKLICTQTLQDFRN